MRSAFLPCLIMLPVALVGCASVPVRDRTEAAQADWPVLLPIENIIAAPVPTDVDPTLQLEARAARLRARAAALAATDI